MAPRGLSAPVDRAHESERSRDWRPARAHAKAHGLWGAQREAAHSLGCAAAVREPKDARAPKPGGGDRLPSRAAFA